MKHDDVIAAVAIAGLVAVAAISAPLSLKTETTITSNGMKRVAVFRKAGDMNSTNKISSSRLNKSDSIDKVKDSFLSKDELAKKEQEIKKKVDVIKFDPVVEKEKPKEEPKDDSKEDHKVESVIDKDKDVYNGK